MPSTSVPAFILHSGPTAQAGIPASKLIHYGPIEGTVAHLSRRAAENRSAMQTANVERQMIKKELRRRILKQ